MNYNKIVIRFSFLSGPMLLVSDPVDLLSEKLVVQIQQVYCLNDASLNIPHCCFVF